MILMFLYIVFTITGLVLIKMGGQNLSLTFNNIGLNLSINFKTMLGFIFYIISFLLWMIILSKTDIKLSILFPVITAIIQIVIIAF